MAIRAIIFDIDGVLADSRKAVVHNTATLMQEFGFIVNEEQVEKQSRAHSADTVLLSLEPGLKNEPEKLRKMLRRLSELTVENMGMVVALPLAGKVPLFAQKYKLAVASNRKASAVLVVKKFGLEKFFAAILTSADAPAKPDPAMIRLALKKLGVKPEEAVFVGDNMEDKQAGEGAGVRTVVVNGSDPASVQVFLEEFLPGL